jgi:RNA polymerase sigma-70 factor, ECF subfamily
LNEAASDYLEQQLARARQGEAAGLAALVRAHQQSVYSLALRMLGTKDLAEDLTQDVFMQLNGSLRSIESNQHLAFWLRKVTTHRAIDEIRRRSRFAMTSLDDAGQLFSVDETGDPLLHRHLHALLLQLSPPARAVLLLRFQEDLDPMEIARTLDMPLNTVKSHLKRSLDTLRLKTSKAQAIGCEDHSP